MRYSHSVSVLTLFFMLSISFFAVAQEATVEPTEDELPPCMECWCNPAFCQLSDESTRYQQAAEPTPACDYMKTKEDCDSECLDVGVQSCVRDNTIYYSECGTTKCLNSQECKNGGCQEINNCNYTVTEGECMEQCREVGALSCVKNGTTYYSECGVSKCSTGYTCKRATCRRANSCTFNFPPPEQQGQCIKWKCGTGSFAPSLAICVDRCESRVTGCANRCFARCIVRREPFYEGQISR